MTDSEFKTGDKVRFENPDYPEFFDREYVVDGITGGKLVLTTSGELFMPSNLTPVSEKPDVYTELGGRIDKAIDWMKANDVQITGQRVSTLIELIKGE